MRVQEEGYSRRGPSFDYEGTRKRLFQKRTVFWLWGYKKKVIPEEDRLLTMRVQEEGYSRRGPSFDYEGTRRRLFQKRTMLTWIFSIITSFIHINSKCNVWSSWEYIYVKTGQETELSELILRNLAHCEWKKTN